MGVVYRAEDPLIHRTVAVKVLHATPGLTPEQIGTARQRFGREAQTAGGIDHPNIIRILDVGEEMASGEMYIVMEYIRGPSLEKMLTEDDLSVEKAVEILGQIASGLDAAHARGIIHRDIKPSNILFNDRGVAKLADFGITHVATSCLTQDMSELGTPAYMSPEQVSGRILDPQADNFSLGVLGYEILAGRKPFRGDDAVSTAYAIVHTEPLPPSTVNPELPKGFDAIFRRVLAKEPEDRFPSAKEFHEALVACLSERESAPSHLAAHHAKRRARKRLALGLAAVVATALVASVLPRNDPDPSASEASTSSTATPKPAAPSAVAAPAAPSRRAAPSVSVAISLSHRLRRGKLIVSVDGATVLDEGFTRKLALPQTLTFHAIQATAGTHRVTATIRDEDGRTYAAEATTVRFAEGESAELRFRFKKDVLTLAEKRG